MNYKVLVTDEAINDIFDLIKYIRIELCNPSAADRLYSNLNREINNMGDFPLKFSDSGVKYRGYIIHKKVYESYLLFYIISDENHAVYVLRVLKDLMNWRKILEKSQMYHFSQYEE
ncbi:MAG: type II toxin-antitoxin system RelE/ParE family toxin [Lachnospiraceae bacterium]|nr:type II toxin-antitoxin system RelE/ParE family toxin [Lachnospiraceae bacterium]